MKNVSELLHQVIDLLVELKTQEGGVSPSGVWLNDVGNMGWAPGVIQPGNAMTSTIDVVGAETGDFCFVSTESQAWEPWDVVGVTLTGIAGPNKVKVTIANNGTKDFDPGSATYHARVMKRVSP